MLDHCRNYNRTCSRPPTMDQLFKKYSKLVDSDGDPCARQSFLEEVGRYLWNGWGKTIQAAAEKLIKDETEWKKKTAKERRANSTT